VPALHAVAAVQARYPSLRIAEAGDASEDRVGNALVSHDFRKAESTSLPVTLILLVAVFGALIAAGIPLLLAGTAVISAISLTSVIGQWLPTGSSTSEVVLLIGMAVGIDYSLFYLRREREERSQGRSTSEAARPWSPASPHSRSGRPGSRAGRSTGPVRTRQAGARQTGARQAQLWCGSMKVTRPRRAWLSAPLSLAWSPWRPPPARARAGTIWQPVQSRLGDFRRGPAGPQRR
jgi:MMPL family